MNAPSKGPLEVRQSPQNMNYFIFSPDHKIAVAGVNRLIGKGVEEGFANSQLLGAAHDLLIALQDLYAQGCGMPKSCGHDFVCVCPGDKAKASIAKATKRRA